MKSLILILGLFLLFPFLVNAQSFPMKSYFCAVETPHEGIYCTEIKKGVTFTMNKACLGWANSLGLPLAGTFSNTNYKALYDQQNEVCDALVGKGKWQCFLIEDCGTSSSIGNISMRVFSPENDTAAARDKCVEDAWAQYKEALINVNHGCSIAPDAVMMQF